MAAGFRRKQLMINQVIMGIMAGGVVIGAVDWIFGNRKGYGRKME